MIEAPWEPAGWDPNFEDGYKAAEDWIAQNIPALLESLGKVPEAYRYGFIVGLEDTLSDYVDMDEDYVPISVIRELEIVAEEAILGNDVEIG